MESPKEVAIMRSDLRVPLVEVPLVLLMVAMGAAGGFYLFDVFADWPELAQWKPVTLCMVGVGTVVICAVLVLYIEAFAAMAHGRPRKAAALMRGISYLLLISAVIVLLYCAAFWVLTKLVHPSTVAAFLMAEWLCVGTGVYASRYARYCKRDGAVRRPSGFME